MTLLNLRTARRPPQTVAIALILLGLGTVVFSTTYPQWGLRAGLPQPESLRLAEVNAEISSWQKKFLEAELRGVRVDPVPRFFVGLQFERDALLDRAEYAKGRPGRFAKRVQYVGVGLMAAGVGAYFVSRMRKRSAS